jgi:hypothetical protein
VLAIAIPVATVTLRRRRHPDHTTVGLPDIDA